MKCFVYIFTSSIVSVFSNDVGSLMQVGVKGHAQHGVGLALDTISDELTNLPLHDNTNKLAIESLMATIGVEPNIVDVSDTLRNIISILRDVLLVYVAARDTMQAEIDIFTDTHIPACNALNVQGESDARGVMEGDRTTHSDCRDQEHVEYLNMTGDCDPLIEQLRIWDARTPSTIGDPSEWDNPSGTVTDICIVPTPGNAADGNIAAWGEWLQGGETEFEERGKTLAALKGPCVDATKAHNDQHDQCDIDQLTFEQAFCTLRNEVHKMCSQRYNCGYAQHRAFAAGVAAWQLASDTRKSEAAVIDHVLCLIDNLINGIYDYTVCAANGSDIASYHALYGNDINYPPAVTSCSNSTVDEYPGSAGFATHGNSEYADMTSPVTHNTIHDCGTISYS